VSKGKQIYIERGSILCIATILVSLTAVARAQTPVSMRSGAASEPEIVASGTGEVSAEPAKAAKGRAMQLWLQWWSMAAGRWRTARRRYMR
jgi:hypothetical protein